MKITFEHYDRVVSIEEDREDFTAGEIIRMFTELLVAASFPPSIIKDEDGNQEWFYKDNKE